MDSKLADVLIFVVGFASQILFFARTIVQWFKSEQAGKVLSPLLFWQISLIASILMLIYGILRKDFAIILGQFITFFIYIRNLQLQGEWKKIPGYFRISVTLMPFICLTWIILSGNYNLHSILNNEDIAHWLLIFGITAQIVFTFRFIYQWLLAEKTKESALPLGFWYISIIGSSMTIVYAILRRDPVLLLGNLGGLVMYVRNLILHFTGKGLFDLLPFDVGVVKKYFGKKNV
ncbi:MAG: lipid-A-disaccharide synthase N-terminal domain-containing protein [Prolixibacteraceae bacterium]